MMDDPKVDEISLIEELLIKDLEDDINNELKDENNGSEENKNENDVIKKNVDVEYKLDEDKDYNNESTENDTEEDDDNPIKNNNDNNKDESNNNNEQCNHEITVLPENNVDFEDLEKEIENLSVGEIDNRENKFLKERFSFLSEQVKKPIKKALDSESTIKRGSLLSLKEKLEKNQQQPAKKTGEPNNQVPIIKRTMTFSEAKKGLIKMLSSKISLPPSPNIPQNNPPPKKLDMSKFSSPKMKIMPIKMAGKMNSMGNFDELNNSNNSNLPHQSNNTTNNNNNIINNINTNTKNNNEDIKKDVGENKDTSIKNNKTATGQIDKNKIRLNLENMILKNGSVLLSQSVGIPRDRNHGDTSPPSSIGDHKLNNNLDPMGRKGRFSVNFTDNDELKMSRSSDSGDLKNEGSFLNDSEDVNSEEPKSNEIDDNSMDTVDEKDPLMTSEDLTVPTEPSTRKIKSKQEKEEDKIERRKKQLEKRNNFINRLLSALEKKNLFDIPDSPQNIRFNEEKSKNIEEEPLVQGVTITKLIQRLTFDKYPNPELVMDFLMIYQSFMTPCQLLSFMSNRYEVKEPENLDENEKQQWKIKTLKIRLRVAGVLKTWIMKKGYEFDDGKLHQQLNSFLQKMKTTKGLEKTAESLQKLIFKSSQGGLTLEKPPKSFLPPKKISFGDMTIRDVHPTEISRQLCLADFLLYSKIRSSELCEKNWQSYEKKEKSPNLLSFIEQFNRVSNWVTTQVLKTTDLKQRAATLSRFIAIGWELKTMQNFNGVMQVVSGLQNASLHRLKKTWSLLPTKIWNIWCELVKFVESKDNFSEIRKVLSICNLPALPYLGIFLSDIVFVDDGNKDYLTTDEEEEGLVNFNKFRHIANIIKTITYFQEKAFNFTSVPIIQQFIFETYVFTQKEMQLTSLELEPRN